MDSKGIFITIEGGEGVGKSSFTTQLIDRLKRDQPNKSITTTREPGGTPVADKLRQVFVQPPADDPLFPMTELLIVSAARTQHVQAKVKPALQRGDLVVCDRFYDSTRVYQGILAGLNRKVLEDVIEASVVGVHPHVTFLLDCPVEVSMQRLQHRHQQASSNAADVSRYDLAGKESHEKLRQAFLQLAREYKDRFVVIDATPDTKTMVEQCWRALRGRGLIG